MPRLAHLRGEARGTRYPLVVRQTKIIATLGPASASPGVISGLVAAGMDVARLNFSHGDHDSHAAAIRWVREAAAEHSRAVGVLQDIQGPRIRVGTFPGGSVELERDTEVRLVDGSDEGDAGLIHVQHLASAHLRAGSRVLLADGLITLEVTDTDGESAAARVVEGGTLSDRKGAAFPGTRVDLPAITPKDVADLAFGAEHGVDMVAASFVTTGEDIALVKEQAGDVPVIAKIERAEAYGNLEAILRVADGAMVARGDLGIELGLGPLPRAQKEIIAATNLSGRISITATEMLESMTSAPRPTRAEVTDVANAVLDGTDAVMLSAETAIGKYPVRVVEVMGTICLEAEASPGYPAPMHVDSAEDVTSFANAIAIAVSRAAGGLGLETVVAFTESGTTARLVSKHRPKARIVAFTTSEVTRNRLALVWGVLPLMFPRLDSTDEMIALAEQRLLELGLVGDGEAIAMAAGIPPNQQATTNLLKLHVIGEGTAGVPTQ